jgi:16S rRNA (guanine527-N7)-methyltransferase
MVYLHLIDSLMVQPFLQGNRLLDVGTGAGLPGVPLAIVNPEKNWVLLDKNNKKTRFLTQLIAELDLKNVQVVHARCEDFKTKDCFDSILSRALGSLQWFHDVTKHLICPNGKWIAMKGKYPQDELAYLPYVTEVSRLTIKGMDIKRHIVTFKEGITWEK